MIDVTIVIPTIGRACLADLLADLAAQPVQPATVHVVDDRPNPESPLKCDHRVLQSGGRGPAAARNLCWWSAETEWIAFLDDDVRLPADWMAGLADDLRDVEADIAGVQGAIVVPTSERPTDWERSTAGLQDAKWATADLAYRRTALEQVGGFDERFRRAYREDAELALRLRQKGWRLIKGRRHVVHPVRPEGFWVSVRVQRGNADDALMRAVHGRRWRTLAECPRGRLPWHVATVLSAGASLIAGRKAAAVWALLTADFARRRIAPGPRTPAETGRMAVTSVVLPFAAVWHRTRGTWQHRGSKEWPQGVLDQPSSAEYGRGDLDQPSSAEWGRGVPDQSRSAEWGPGVSGQPRSAALPNDVRAVLFDRDGTLVHDVPYNGDPAKVRPVPRARQAVRRLRRAGVAVGVITNQSGIGRSLITAEQVASVNGRIDRVLGPFDTWQVCPHVDTDGCACRKPAPGLVLAAAAELGVSPSQVVVVGDIGSDVEAARAAGARAVLVPTATTRPEEIRAADTVRPDLLSAVKDILAGRLS